MDSPCGARGLPGRVSPFRHPRIEAYLQLPAAFRSLSRLSSALSAKASSLCSFLLNLQSIPLRAPSVAPPGPAAPCGGPISGCFFLLVLSFSCARRLFTAHTLGCPAYLAFRPLGLLSWLILKVFSIRFSRCRLASQPSAAFRGCAWLIPHAVGLSGLEPPTSRLSGVRSNQLSYKPIIWHPPALPCRPQHSTIGRPGLNWRVRDGYVCHPRAHRHRILSAAAPRPPRVLTAQQ